MNIKDILKYGDYEVLEEIISSEPYDGLPYKFEYIVKMTQRGIEKHKELIRKVRKEEANRWNFEFIDPDNDPESIAHLLPEIRVIVKEVGFNINGYLFITLARHDCPEECWDVIEFGDNT